MLEDPREEPLADHLVRRALDVLTPAPDASEARRRVVRTGDGETALVLEELADRIRELRIGHEHRPRLPVVEDEEPERQAHLGTRETDAGRVDHGLDHVVEELAERRTELGDRLRRLTEDRIAQRSDAKDHVRSPS